MHLQFLDSRLVGHYLIVILKFLRDVIWRIDKITQVTSRILKDPGIMGIDLNVGLVLVVQ